MTVRRPTVVGYFEVRTPWRSGGPNRDGVASEVERYLYGGFSRVETLPPVSEADPYWTSTIRFESYRGDVEQAKRDVEYQQDRFRSGLITPTDPTYYTPQEDAE